MSSSPLTVCSAGLVREAQSLYGSLFALSGRTRLRSATRWLTTTHMGARITLLLARRGIRLSNQVDTATLSGAKLVSGYVIEHSGEVAGNLTVLDSHFAIALITLFYFLRDGESYYVALLELMPLHEDNMCNF